MHYKPAIMHNLYVIAGTINADRRSNYVYSFSRIGKRRQFKLEFQKLNQIFRNFDCKFPNTRKENKRKRTKEGGERGGAVAEMVVGQRQKLDEVKEERKQWRKFREERKRNGGRKCIIKKAQARTCCLKESTCHSCTTHGRVMVSFIFYDNASYCKKDVSWFCFPTTSYMAKLGHPITRQSVENT
ncbi:hypothetical protein M9H77_04837 [Catharanthus roseus]|uniref:Uncharacterized protein n=1 Tax=Catharanthus roseus TaxID=4058 RepID=A0ACC0CFP2_CATRO|nr:hypothetical protein M9H77_04837 [Catharanthus roseus]